MEMIKDVAVIMSDQTCPMPVFRIFPCRILIVDQWGILGQCLIHSKHSWQFFVLNLDLAQCSLRNCLVRGGNCGDDISRVPDLFQCYDRLILDVSTIMRGADLQVILRDDRNHTVHRSGSARVDMTDSSMRNRATENLTVEHPCDFEITGVYRSTCYLFRAVDAGNTLSDDL